MEVKFLYLVAVLVATACHARTKSYENYKVYTIKPLGNGQLELLSDFTSDRQYDFWTPLRTEGPSDVMVMPEEQAEFEDFLKTHGIPYSLKIENLERVLEIEKTHQISRNAPGEISFTKYNRYGEILAYLKKLSVTHKHLVSLETFAKTFEKRDLMVVKISTGGSNKPTILIDGGIHAREWIAPAQVLFIIKELVENPKNRKMIENVDWHIIPVLNPDGYEYSHTNDRMWRKTRSSSRKRCVGVDPNRNFDFHWGGLGTSSNKCAENYKGPNPFSESETRGLRDLILKNRGQYKFYLTFHSYGQYIMFPWGYTKSLPEDAEELRSLGNMTANAIKNVNGTQYKVGSVTECLKPAAGGSIDWVKAVGGIKYVYAIELPGGTGSDGFHINPSKILPIVRETFEGIIAFHSFVETL